MVNVYLNLSIFTMFLKNKNIILKIRTSKVTDYAALRFEQVVVVEPVCLVPSKYRIPCLETARNLVYRCTVVLNI